MLTLGDYTLKVSAYKTLCIDDPNEASSTPSMKRLFSNHGEIIKQLLDIITINSDIESQLKSIIKDSKLSQSDWRYCFIKYTELFNQMSISHLRLREVNDEILIIPNKSSNGYNEEVFISALKIALQKHNIKSYIESELGM